jgi:hypothetical protein
MADEIDGVEETGAAPKPAAAAASAASGTTAPAGPPDPKAIASRKKRPVWLDKDWNIVAANTPGAVSVTVQRTMTKDGYWKDEVLDGSGQPYKDALKEGGPADDPEAQAQAKAFDQEIKRQGTTTTGTVDVNGHKFQIITRKNPVDQSITNEITNLTTGEKVDRLPVDKSGPGGPKTVLQKGGDGKTYAVTIDPDGNLVGFPKDTGIPPETKEAQVFNVPGIGLVRVDGKGNSALVYDVPKDPNVKVEKDPKSGRWVKITTDPRTGQTSVEAIKVQGVDASTATPMGPLPNDGEVTKWLWDQQALVDQRVNSGELTREEATSEMDNRLKFAQTLVAERAKKEAREDKDRDRGATLMGTIQPGVREAQTVAQRFLPGEGSGESASRYVQAIRNRSMELARALGALPPVQPGVSRLAGPPPSVAPDTTAAPAPVGTPTAGEPGGPPLAPGPVLGDTPAPAPAPVVPDPATAAAAAAAAQAAAAPASAPPPVTAEQAAELHRAGVNPATGEPNGLAAPAPAPAQGTRPGPLLKPGAMEFTPDPNGGTPGGRVLPQPAQPAQYGDAGDTQMNRIPLDPDELAAIEEKYANGTPGQMSQDDIMRLIGRIMGVPQPPSFAPQQPQPAVGSLNDFGGPGPLEGALEDIAGGDPTFAAALEEARRRSRGTVLA